MIYEWELDYFGNDPYTGGVCMYTVTIAAPTAEDALTIYRVRHQYPDSLRKKDPHNIRCVGEAPAPIKKPQ
jgi:hypothetical protein